MPSEKKTVVIRHREAIGGGGFFETQVEVVEKDEVIELSGDEKDIEEQLAKRKGDRIFAFNDFHDFRAKYFGGREVDALEEVTRIQQMKLARAKYSKRQAAVNSGQSLHQ